MNNPEITIENVGPITSLSFPLMPGVTVLRGENGSGKTTAINGVSKMLGGDGRGLSARDGAKRGEIALGDAVLAITTSRASVRGELEVVGIEGRLDIGELVEPGLLDPEKNDDRRIKALISLSGVKANPAIFFDICGGADAYASLGIDEKTPDILTLAGRVKRALDAKGLAFEKSSEQYTAEKNSLQKAAEGVDLEAEADEAKLFDAWGLAKEDAARLRQHNKNAAEAELAASEAKAMLDAMGADDGLPLLREKHLAINGRLGGVISSIAKLEAQLAELREEKAGLVAEANALIDQLEAAEKAAESRAELAAKVHQSIPTPYSDGAIAEADAAVAKAREAMERGAAVRLAKQQLADADRKGANAKTNTQAARKFRAAAKAVDDVLTSLLPSDCPLRVEAGRLVVETDRSKSEPYASLSDGERWLVAIRFAAKQLPKGGLLTLSQSAWGEIQPANQRLIAAEAVRLGIHVLTAEAADCELTAEHLGGEPALVGTHDEESE